ncbi:HEPN domain-containing protein [Patescibacteria group bacterium]|nr:HEPN domain-containing protein [Patescibacteria group bacterium]
MNQKNELNALEWVNRAKDDERSIKAILKDESGAPSTACFLSQQMAEKYFKAFLVYSKEGFQKIHHLDRLLELCIEVDPTFSELTEDAILLNDYYIDTRYPGDVQEFSFDEAREAFEMAQKIKEVVMVKLR